MIMDVPIILEGEIPAFLIIGSMNIKARTRIMIYYLLSEGKHFLKDGKNCVGLRNVEVKKGMIICKSLNLVTGYEEFCGYLDENGDIISKTENASLLPSRLKDKIKVWCSERKDLLNFDFGIDDEGVWMRSKRKQNHTHRGAQVEN